MSSSVEATTTLVNAIKIPRAIFCLPLKLISSFLVSQNLSGPISMGVFVIGIKTKNNKVRRKENKKKIN